ncbi:ABC transporter ATP-binding protein [Patescibacteria group bacterium]|nr:ABC transporter ATP-binding protein [Patescibacteria group bacterium]
MKPIIEIRNLSKKYKIGVKQPYYSLRDSITGTIANASKLFSLNQHQNNNRLNKDEFWALRGISLNCQPGEIVGVIGRNGAGKSTLLKILSQVTPPSKGEVLLRGRVASLLEVGTGFHPELTGSENIYLNGAILGMRRSEVNRKFSEIVDFSEIAKFIDTPVKRYSSGMYMRLAFAVAAYLESEILLVDEVLTVGDSAFQKKCLGRMEAINHAGRTVIFVSHNMSSIEALCNRTVVLSAGKVVYDGATKKAIQHYLNFQKKTSQDLLSDVNAREGSGEIRITSLEILNDKNQPVSVVQSGEDYKFKISYHNPSKETIKNVVIGIEISDELGSKIIIMRTTFTNDNYDLVPGKGELYCEIKDLPLALGSYHLSLIVTQADIALLDHIENAMGIDVEGGDYFGTGSIGAPERCKILTKAHWSKGAVE